jgi:hypothetical protein
MTTARKVGGNADSHHLSQALSANEDACRLVADMADVIAQDRRLAGQFIRLSMLLSRQRGDLMEMRIIRNGRPAPD